MTLPNSLKIKKLGRWIALAIFGILLLSLFSGKASILHLYQSHVGIKKKEEAVLLRHKEIDFLKIENGKLKNDTAYMEKIGREKLGMARKDEKVYKFIQGH